MLFIQYKNILYSLLFFIIQTNYIFIDNNKDTINYMCRRNFILNLQKGVAQQEG